MVLPVLAAMMIITLWLFPKQGAYLGTIIKSYLFDLITLGFNRSFLRSTFCWLANPLRGKAHCKEHRKLAKFKILIFKLLIT